ncbi:thioredoxin fold domain-containing protein [Flavobacterium sp. GA093]|uniref:Thioredoxin fold domain-containing protein n=1 Tax=Flavobacterium hydrocarbonoxydans TaxID=2683249 RepID=A0A6I4NNP0_9FLAO|nr:thioredoxin domain-containing protein [Flavobacterium hydrocarbonoxydans]MWB94602.1 thioredoxin fold domain-containing protein [Flavobacterium hydrocarbonoxydans]
MKFFQTLSILFLLIFTSCNGQPSSAFEEVAPKDFAEKIKTTDNAQILDVRTPEEFASEHLDNAKNVDWNGEDFDKKAATYDKSKPVFVYCLSGGRSKKAASKLKELGFETVYELEGGILKWKSEGLSKPTTEQIGMTRLEFNKLLDTDKKVLVDFYAEWCGPCKKMEPYLLKMQKEMANEVTIIRIDVDQNKTLATQLEIDQLPIVVLYQNKEVKWKNVGYISEQDLKKQL